MKKKKFVLAVLLAAALGVACGLVTVKMLRPAKESEPVPSAVSPTDTETTTTTTAFDTSSIDSGIFRIYMGSDGLRIFDVRSPQRGELVIPSEMGGIPVTEIGSAAFSGQGITSVIIPEGVTHIWSDAFASSSVSSVTLPSTLKFIGDGCFGNCHSLTDITIPNGVESIGTYAFGDSGLTEITLPDSVTTLGEQAFFSCRSLKKAHISGVKDIPDYCFDNCVVLDDVTLTEGTVSIGKYAFSGCTKLTKLVIPESVESIGDYALSNYSGKLTVYAPHDPTYYYGGYGTMSDTMSYEKWVRTDGQ